MPFLAPTPLLLVLALAPRTQDPGGAPGTRLGEDPVIVPCDFSSGRPVVDVLLNGEGPFTMILDTGNTVGDVLVNADLARELELPVTGETRAGDPSDTDALRLERVQVDSLFLGEAEFVHRSGVSWERPPELVRAGVRGILGLPLFADCLLGLDARAGTVRLERGALPEPDGHRVLPFRVDDFGAVTLEMDVAGISVATHLDTGNARDVSLPGALRERLSVVPGSEARARALRASGPVELVIARLDGEIRVGDVVFSNPRVAFDDSMVVANVGQELLARAALTIDLANRRLEVRPHADGAGPAPDRPRPRSVRGALPGTRRTLGVQLRLGGSPEVAVDGVQPGSLAERIGLRPGDVLLRVDGREVSTADLVPLQEALARDPSFRIAVSRDGEELVLQVPAAPGAGASEPEAAPPDPEALLARMEGSYEVHARRFEPDGTVREIAGRSTFERLEELPFLRERFVLEVGGEELHGEAYLAWRPAARRFELTQLDAFSPTTFWLTGAWDPARERLALRTVPESLPARPVLRWEYRFEPDGEFVKEMLTPDESGEPVLRSDYRYVRAG